MKMRLVVNQEFTLDKIVLLDTSEDMKCHYNKHCLYRRSETATVAT